ncbi:molybdenum cofactor biosynthesis protein [Bacillus sp. 7586-K]|uniref:Molybdenum cofactor biosynthesis protein B n=1 Tax=Metabacillus niabensis TaxID=324854 RepID=A0ABT9YY03_9BACI|nr:MogA/MoaB family molybdenum cofactor biosynthesis protein [Metabacillus niabensis]MDQ0224599.1 molybdenum cofactor biosynthesis protein B [Metabacillus niabensis]PAD66087.1 molybdenum cofactor biosynthesis protein [Bacillus sp. 7586-K]
MSSIEHKKEAPRFVQCKVITISDTRTKQTDKSGTLINQLLSGNGHKVVDYCIVKDEETQIREAIIAGCHSKEIDAIITNGGTGIAKRDVTIEAVQSIIEKEIPGFGEIFRMLSYQVDIGSSAILSRAIAGVFNDTVILSVPGSTGAVKLAMEKLILPELGHIMREVTKDL